MIVVPFDAPLWLWVLSLAALGYTVVPRTWIPGELVTAGMMNGIRDLFLDIEAGDAEMVRVLLEGKTSVELESLESGAGQATLAYDTDLDAIVVSLNEGDYVLLGGGDASQIVFTPQRNQPPATAYATPDVRNSHPVLDFDPSTDESALFGDVFWPDYAAENVQVVIMWAATTATTGDVVWNAAFERISASGLDIDADSFAAVQAATVTTDGVSGELTYTTITFTSAQIDGLLAGEAFRLKVTRDADHANDTMAGDAEILRVVLRKVAA